MFLVGVIRGSLIFQMCLRQAISALEQGGASMPKDRNLRKREIRSFTKRPERRRVRARLGLTIYLARASAFMPNLDYEKQHGRGRGMTVCGVDEAGRGPLAGPVMAAAVILPASVPRAMTKEIRDSKKMTAKQREDLFEPLTRLCHHAVAEATVEEILRFNILWASMLAMKRAVEGLEDLLMQEQHIPLPLAGGARGGLVRQKNKFGIYDSSCSSPPPTPPASGRGVPPFLPQTVSAIPKIHVALIDGNRSPQLACKAIPIVKGDDLSLSIAAASIIAKVTRDRFMKKLAEEHPGYGWERNAGYGTSEHLTALRQLGKTPWHRAAFALSVMQCWNWKWDRKCWSAISICGKQALMPIGIPNTSMS